MNLEIVDRGRVLAFSFEDLMRYQGPGSPGGVARDRRPVSS